MCMKLQYRIYSAKFRPHDASKLALGGSSGRILGTGGLTTHVPVVYFTSPYKAHIVLLGVADFGHEVYLVQTRWQRRMLIVQKE